MIDNFALGLSHGLLLLVAWRLLFRPDLEDDNAPPSPAKPLQARWGSPPAEEREGA